jgi:cob(I)alamin adenosyltransferase
MASMRKGYVQVYTGEGKGKTTAALGLALRAAGAGARVLIAQFIKKTKCCEHKALERFCDLVTVVQFGTGFIKGSKRTPAELRAAEKGIDQVERLLTSGEYDMVILDEINVAVHAGLVCADTVIRIIDEKPAHVELVLTGRHADKRIIQKADLVTEMKEIKHYMKMGVGARKGIEM